MNFRSDHIEIDGGRVSGSFITDALGRHPDYSNIGDFMFFVVAVEPDGGRLGLWSGLSYDQAIREAEGARRDFCPDRAVLDVIGSAR